MLIHINDFLRKYNVKVRGVIQVGAHYAEEYEGWVEDGIDKFIMFEPISSNYKKLESILCGKNNVRLFNLALGDTRGFVNMHTEVAHGGKSCSVLKPHLHKIHYPDIVFDGTESVRIDMLDNIEFDRSSYNMLSIDTQGYEWHVLNGSCETLKYIDVIETEVYRSELYEGCAMISDIDELLVDYTRVYTYWCGGWGNAYYVRK